MFIVVVSLRWSDDDLAARLQNHWRGRGLMGAPSSLSPRVAPVPPRPAAGSVLMSRNSRSWRWRSVSSQAAESERSRPVSFSEKRLLSFSRRLIWMPRAGGADSWCHRRRDRPAEPQSNYPVHCSIQQRVPERHRTGLITEQTQLISPDTFYSFWTDRKTETNPSCIMQTSRLQPLTGAI